MLSRALSTLGSRAASGVCRTASRSTLAVLPSSSVPLQRLASSALPRATLLPQTQAPARQQEPAAAATAATSSLLTHGFSSSVVVTPAILGHRLLQQRYFATEEYDLKEPEAVIDIERDMCELLQVEQDRLEARLLELTALRDAVAESGFTLQERESEAILSRRFEDRNITITWDPTIAVADIEPHPSDIDPDAEADAAEAEAAESEAGVANGDEAVSSDIEVHVHIESHAKTLIAHCAIAEDGLLYVYQLSSPSSARSVKFDKVSQSLQHRIYDYLESLGVGDSVAMFIRKFNQLQSSSVDMQGLTAVNQFFKTSVAKSKK